MGLYEMYVLAARADTALMRRKLARSLYARAKLRNRQLKRQYLHNQKEYEFVGGYEEGRPDAIRTASINIYLYNNQRINI
jgi:hypothetical protein